MMSFSDLPEHVQELCWKLTEHVASQYQGWMRISDLHGKLKNPDVIQCCVSEGLLDRKTNGVVPHPRRQVETCGILESMLFCGMEGTASIKDPFLVITTKGAGEVSHRRLASTSTPGEVETENDIPARLRKIDPPSENDPCQPLWEENDDIVYYGDTKMGIVGKVKIGTAAWAALKVLSEYASKEGLQKLAEEDQSPEASRKRELPVPEEALKIAVFAKKIDEELARLEEMRELAKSACKEKDRVERVLQDFVNDDGEFSGLTVMRTRRGGRKTSYSSCQGNEVIERIQGVIRKSATDRDKALQWRSNWIYWDSTKMTVSFGRK